MKKRSNTLTIRLFFAKISNPTVIARIEPEELDQFLRGCGWIPIFVEGHDPATMHRVMAEAVEQAVLEIARIRKTALTSQDAARPLWPMIVLRSSKGWTGPKELDGLEIEGTARAHQVPVPVDAAHPEHVARLESWMRSYRADGLFDEHGENLPEIRNWQWGDSA